MICGLTYNFLPFMILPLYASPERLDLRLVEAGDLLRLTVGVVPPRHVAAVPAGVVAGTLLTFIPAAGDLINSRLLGTRRRS